MYRPDGERVWGGADDEAKEAYKLPNTKSDVYLFCCVEISNFSSRKMIKMRKLSLPSSRILSIQTSLSLYLCTSVPLLLHVF